MRWLAGTFLLLSFAALVGSNFSLTVFLLDHSYGTIWKICPARNIGISFHACWAVERLTHQQEAGNKPVSAWREWREELEKQQRIYRYEQTLRLFLLASLVNVNHRHLPCKSLEAKLSVHRKSPEHEMGGRLISVFQLMKPFGWNFISSQGREDCEVRCAYLQIKMMRKLEKYLSGRGLFL